MKVPNAVRILHASAYIGLALQVCAVVVKECSTFVYESTLFSIRRPDRNHMLFVIVSVYIGVVDRVLPPSEHSCLLVMPALPYGSGPSVGPAV